MICIQVTCIYHIQVRVRVMVFNTTFNNISVKQRRSDLLVEESRIPGENHYVISELFIMVSGVFYLIQLFLVPAITSCYNGGEFYISCLDYQYKYNGGEFYISCLDYQYKYNGGKFYIPCLDYQYKYNGGEFYISCLDYQYKYNGGEFYSSFPDNRNNFFLIIPKLSTDNTLFI